MISLNKYVDTDAVISGARQKKPVVHYEASGASNLHRDLPRSVAAHHDVTSAEKSSKPNRKQ